MSGNKSSNWVAEKCAGKQPDDRQPPFQLNDEATLKQFFKIFENRLVLASQPSDRFYAIFIGQLSECRQEDVKVVEVEYDEISDSIILLADRAGLKLTMLELNKLGLRIPKLFTIDLAWFMQQCWKPPNPPSFLNFLLELESLISKDSLKSDANSFLADKEQRNKEINDVLIKLKRADQLKKEGGEQENEQQRKKQEQEQEKQQRQKRLQFLESMLQQQRRDYQHRIMELQNGLLKLLPESEQYDIKDINSWTKIHVYTWILQISNEGNHNSDLGEYADLFLENDITGQRLLMLNFKNLESMGISSIGHRLALCKEIEQLKHENHGKKCNNSVPPFL